MLKAVIFDFDGMILDTEAIWFDIYQAWFKKNFKYDLPIEEFLWCVGANSDRLFDYLESERNIKVDRVQFAKDTFDDFLAGSKTLPARAGIEALIIETKELGLQLALATSASLEKPTFHLTRLALIDYFDVIVTSDDVENIKPHPDLFLEALRQLKVEPNEAVVFEDSKSGLEAANKANIPTIVIPNNVTKYSEFIGYHKKIQSGLDITIKELFEETQQ